ncbi:MAG TPA: hypothetical protein PLU67_01740 [Candidatus Kapabacteria bacterium]|nr:hypothetical protein [Candidatus Kapabacteria bacterium]
MKYTFFLKIAVLLLFLGQNAHSNTYSSYSGRNFYVSFMQNEIHLNKDPLVLRIFLTSLYPANYQVIMPGETFTGSLKANEIKEIEVPATLEARNSEVPEKLAIQIKSDIPITVYCFSSKLTTSDSYSAIPVSRWGKKYIVASYPNDQYVAPERENLDSLTKFVPRSSQFLIIAAYDGTVVSFAPKANTRGGKLANQNYQVTLNQGDVYLVQSYPFPKGFGDLTGTIITGNKPFGLLAGHVRTAIPQNAPYPFDSKDHLVEMLPPTYAWGKNYISAPFDVNSKGDLFRIVALEPETIVEMKKFDGSISYLQINSAGGFYEIRNLSTPIIWNSNKPIQIVQYMQHTGEFGDSKEYDPSMVVLPPVEQFVNEILFLTPRNFRVEDQFKEHRVALVFENSALATLSLDGQKITDMWDVSIENIPNTNYSWTSIRLREGRHKLSSTTGKFSGILYAYGFHDSYAMSLGNSLIDPTNPDTIPSTINISENCGIIYGSVTDLHNAADLGLDYAYVVPELTNNYSWNISEISDTAFFATFVASPIDVFRDGRFTIDFYDKASNRTRYTFNYIGTKIDNIESLSFPNTALKGKDCRNFDITNNSNKIIELRSIDVVGDGRISWNTSQPLPYKLSPKEKISVQVCFTPNGDSTSLSAELRLNFDCDYTKIVNIDGRVFAPQFELIGYDFGKVRLGNEALGFIKITNTGNTNILIENINGFAPFADFQLQNIEFPISLLPREERQYWVVFSPSGRYYYDFDITATNSFGLSATAQIMGEGIAPDINNIIVDFGRKRVGTKNTAAALLKNSGNDATSLTLLSLDGNLDDGNFATLQNLDGLLLGINEEKHLDFSFEPTETINYSTSAIFQCDWELHSPINIEIKGVGTLPEITTYNNRFDTTFVAHDLDSTLLVFETKGNEELAVFDVNIIGGDINAFEIEDLPRHNHKIQPNEKVYFPTKFKPRRAGEHILFLEIVSDALPNYGVKRDTITISGYALPNDTLNYSMKVELQNLEACKYYSGDLVIQNLGNVNINVQSISINKTNQDLLIDFATDISTLLPFSIRPDSALSIPIISYAERNQSGKVEFEMLFNDTLSQILEVEISPITYQIELVEANNLHVVPGDTVKLHIHGRFPNGIDAKIAPTISLSVSRFMLSLLKNNTDFVLKGANTDLHLIAQIEQSKDRINLILGVDSLLIVEPLDFYFTLEFLGLLHTDDSTSIRLNLNADNCFDPLLDFIPLKIINVCNFPLRPIKLITNLPYLSVTPNPIINELVVELYLVDNDEVTLNITDLQGKTMILEESRNFDKGKYILKYDTSQLANGVYNLIVLSKQMKENIIFIKTK